MEVGKGLELSRELESNMWTQEEVVMVRWKPCNSGDAQHSPLQLISAGNSFLCFYLFGVHEVEIWPCVCTLPLSSVAPTPRFCLLNII